MTNKLFRRDFLQIGTLAPLGIGIGASVGHATRNELTTEVSDRRCILVWLDGGPSHLDTFDPKPDAPVEVRGPFDTIATSVSGIRLTEMLPEMATRMNDWTIVRSMTSPLGEHNFGAHYLLTGYRPTPAIEYPSIGSVVAHHRASEQADIRDDLPSNIAVPNHRIGGGRFSGNGFLPATTRPFSVGSDPSKPNFRVNDLDLYSNLTVDRVLRRRTFLESLENAQREMDRDDANGSTDATSQYDAAYRMILSENARDAFRLDLEPNRVRTKYGTKTIGQSCLLARRLIESGVPFVTVNHTGWDTHENAYTRLKEGYTGAQTPVGLVPSLDQALGALIDDLKERGLLETTLVLVMGEFGRTPKLNTAGGRDHWPRAFSVAMSGCGLEGGQVIGSSDRSGEGPADLPVTPSDLAYSVYQRLGIDPRWELQTPDGRPILANRDGNEIPGISPS